MRDFTHPENGPIDRKRFHLFRKRGRFAISLILEIVAYVRFRLAGKRNRCAENDFAYLENAGGAWFR